MTELAVIEENDDDFLWRLTMPKDSPFITLEAAALQELLPGNEHQVFIGTTLINIGTQFLVSAVEDASSEPVHETEENDLEDIEGVSFE